jgi:hypothetical protein
MYAYFSFCYGNTLAEMDKAWEQAASEPVADLSKPAVRGMTPLPASRIRGKGWKLVYSFVLP